MMAGEAWAKLRLGDVCTKIGSGATPRGGSKVYLDSGDVTLIRSQNIYNDRFHHDGLTFLSDEHAEELNNVEVFSGDVLLNITGDSVARCCQVDPSILPGRVNQHVVIIRPDPKRLDPQFLRYFMVTSQTQDQLLSWAGAGATRNALTKGMIESVLVLAPTDLREQRAIAGILGTLDDKIELKRRMSQTLEGMARAIFKSWFVDFDPVRAKAAGKKPTGLSPTIAELFPDSFEDSELGEIPKGWEARPLYDVARFINGAAFKTEDFCESGDGLPVIKIAELKDGIDAQTKFSKRLADPDRLIDTADLLYSWSGSPDTSLDAFLWANGKGLLNQHIFKVVAATTAEKRFVFYLLKYLRPILVETARNKQTTGLGHVTAADMKRLRVCWPSNSILSDFDRTIGPIYEESFLNVLQNRTLAALRDTLLPKLMSGELRVPNAERIAARCI